MWPQKTRANLRGLFYLKRELVNLTFTRHLANDHFILAFNTNQGRGLVTNKSALFERLPTNQEPSLTDLLIRRTGAWLERQPHSITSLT